MKTRMSTPRAAQSRASRIAMAATIPTFFVKSSSSPWRSGSRGVIAIGLIQILMDGGFELRPGHRADDPPAFDTVFEHHQQRNALHVKRGRRAGILVDIELGEA